MADPTRQVVLDAIANSWSTGADTTDAAGVPAWMSGAADAVVIALGDLARARDLVLRWQADRGAFPDGAAAVLEEVADYLDRSGS